MEFNYTIVERDEMMLLGIKQVMPEGNKAELYKFFDGIVQDGRYHKLFSSQKENVGEWNIYTSSPEVEGSGSYLFMVATEFNNSLELSKLDGMTLDFMHVLPAKWLIIRVSSHEEMDHVHKRTLVDRCIEDVGYRLDFDNNRPIMEFQPIACTQNPPYLDFWMPVQELKRFEEEA